MSKSIEYIRTDRQSWHNILQSHLGDMVWAKRMAWLCFMDRDYAGFRRYYRSYKLEARHIASCVSRGVLLEVGISPIR